MYLRYVTLFWEKAITNSYSSLIFFFSKCFFKNVREYAFWRKGRGVETKCVWNGIFP